MAITWNETKVKAANDVLLDMYAVISSRVTAPKSKRQQMYTNDKNPCIVYVCHLFVASLLYTLWMRNFVLNSNNILFAFFSTMANRNARRTTKNHFTPIVFLFLCSSTSHLVRASLVFIYRMWYHSRLSTLVLCWFLPPQTERILDDVEEAKTKTKNKNQPHSETTNPVFFYFRICFHLLRLFFFFVRTKRVPTDEMTQNMQTKIQ